jgi:N-acetylmuramoyl-L-alanine amidase
MEIPVILWRELGDVDRATWDRVLVAAGSPIPLTLGYEAAQPHSALALAMLNMESLYGTAFNRNKPENKNPLNLRPPNGDGYMRFATWTDGIREWKQRITSETYKGGIYARTETIDDLIAVYAPPSDNNDTPAYIAGVKGLLARWGVPTQGGPMPESKPSILLIAGHRNATGGNEFERSLTDDLARAYRDVLRPAGYAVTWLQEADTDADPDDTVGGLDSVSNQARLWCAKTAGPKVVLDLHSEGTAPSVRGGFAIVPDVTGLRTGAPVQQLASDTWESNVLDRKLARALIDRFSAATGIPIRQSGVREPGIMDESQTGVGGDGWRLATFAYTSPHAGDTVRLVVEHGAHSNAQDNAIQRRPDFPAKCATAALEALQDVYGNVPDSQQPEKPKPGPITWKPGLDLGIVDHNGTPVYALLAKVTCVKPKGTQPYVAATTKSAKYGPKLDAGDEIVIVGTTASNWLFWERSDNGVKSYPRVARSGFRPLLPRPQDA